MIVLISENAEHGPGFYHWIAKISNISGSAGIPVAFYATAVTLSERRNAHQKSKTIANFSYNEFNDWSDFLIFSREVKSNDFFVVVTSRKGHFSYHEHLEKLPQH